MTESQKALQDYPLSRDFIDFNRLNLQHQLWRKLFGYNIHPKIPRNDGKLKIADVGVGTGAWTLDILPELDPSAEVVGLDTDITQVGPKEWLPANFTLREWNAFGEVPQDLVGQFDIVNLRLFGFIIRDDPRPVLRNLIKMLKPGGYVQWSDTDIDSWHIRTTSADVPTDHMDELWRLSVPKGTSLTPTWVSSLPQIFETEGLLDVEADWQAGDPLTTLAIHWCNLPVYEMVVNILRPTDPEKAAKIAELIPKAIEQTKKGAMFAFKRVNVVGRKPVA
ncbi:hypothetical protein M426DRAFT_9126 [Hypoxylon sp. CI-4A]|nr:hypothetical protein M426DRAFT_9126 [Hypoxylon sp. CI-4A]